MNKLARHLPLNLSRFSLPIIISFQIKKIPILNILLECWFNFNRLLQYKRKIHKISDFAIMKIQKDYGKTFTQPCLF